MSLLENLFASGRIADVILALVVLEAIALWGLYAWTGRGVAPGPLLTNLAAGSALILAVRSALVQAPWTVTAAWLFAGLIAHCADLFMRWR